MRVLNLFQEIPTRTLQRLDKSWDGNVNQMILKNLALICYRTFATVQDLSRYRKELP